MPQSVATVLVHIVYSTKNRRPWLKGPQTRSKLYAYRTGYGIFSVSPSKIDQVKRYIERQEEHHRRMSFQEEFREKCRGHGIEMDERYVWE